MTDGIGNWQGDLDLIREAARQAAEIARGFFGQSPEVWWKNEGSSPVSAADFAANDRLQSLLMAARPSYGWLSEETDDDTARLQNDTVFVVDPIDGTRAFINGEKTWCVSVAVVHCGRPVAGVLAAPALGEEFYALEGGPAMKNGEVLSLPAGADETGDPELVIAADESTMRRFDAGYRGRLHRHRHVPSLAYRLAMVADGRLDGTIVKRNSHDWDLAAADLIVECAGGRLADLEGKPIRYNRSEVSHGVMVAGSKLALTSLLAHLAQHPAG